MLLAYFSGSWILLVVPLIQNCSLGHWLLRLGHIRSTVWTSGSTRMIRKLAACFGNSKIELRPRREDHGAEMHDENVLNLDCECARHTYTSNTRPSPSSPLQVLVYVLTNLAYTISFEVLRIVSFAFKPVHYCFMAL